MTSGPIKLAVPAALFAVAFLAYVVVILVNPGVSNSILGASALVFLILGVAAALLLGAGFALHRSDSRNDH